MAKYLALLLLVMTPPCNAEISLELEIDPYYSNIGLYAPLTDKEMETVKLKNEKKIYLKLLKDAFKPRFFLLEASVNPLPVLGTWIKKHQSDFYDDVQVTPGFNLVEALTEGFEEPYALSFFVGNVMRFKLPEEKEIEVVNKGYSGFLISFGDQHIKQNTLIDDDWYELEWKFKGDRKIGPIYHSWSFRVGAKIHDNPDITDVTYLGIRREFFNRKLTGYRLLQNTGIDFKLDFSNNNSSLVQGVLYLEKRWPKSSGVFTLGLGLSQTRGKYTGSLQQDKQTRLILRPGYLF